MFEWIIKIIRFFDQHPWDWVAHIILGLLIFVLNYSILRAIDFLIYPMGIELIGGITLFGAVNFVIAVELAQWDIFGISKEMILDSALDLAADLGGIGLGMFFLL